jgi:hypothetical protein
MSTTNKLKELAQLKAKNPTWGRRRLAAALNIPEPTVQQMLLKLAPSAVEAPKPDVQSLAKLAVKLLQKAAASPATLASSLGIDSKTLDDVLTEVEKTHVLDTSGTLLTLTKPSFGRIPLGVLQGGEWVHLGIVGDTHLGCHEERLDALHGMYDIFEREGIKDVLHAGNLVDGYIPKINGATCFVTTPDDQAQYVIDNYPRRDGITTHFITGDDHEGWWIKEGFNWGAYLQMLAKQQGREDLNYIGHVESDVVIVCPEGETIIKVQHPGGGSSYARSYTGQKQVESFQGGEKPQILIQGHYHVSNYMVERNVHVISLPGFQDQTVFARKKRLRMEVGGGLLSFTTNPDGSVARCRLEFKMFFDRGYYRKFLRSDAKVLKGALKLNGRR